MDVVLLAVVLAVQERMWPLGSSSSGTTASRSTLRWRRRWWRQSDPREDIVPTARWSDWVTYVVEKGEEEATRWMRAGRGAAEQGR